MEEINLELEKVIPVGSQAKNHNELEGLGFEESGHIGFASSEELNATKESLQSQIDTNANAIQALSEGIDPEKIDGIKDLIDYVEEHQVDVVSIQEGIEQNASDIDDLEGSVDSIDERVTALEEGGGGVSQEQVDEIENRVDNLELLHQDPLVATFNITTASTAITVKNLTGATQVDWGDGTPIEDISSVTTYAHTYAEVGTYEARFYGKITLVGNIAFAAQTSLWHIYIPSTVISLSSRAFYNDKALRTVEFAYDSGLESIQTEAFRECEKLNKINIPSTVTTIGDYAFYNCKLLDHIELPSNLSGTGLGISSFSSCIALTSISLPKALAKIPDNCFAYCSSLRQLLLPKNIGEIGFGGFQSSSRLEEIYIYYGVLDSGLGIPNGIVINTNAFNGCDNLKRVIIDKGNAENQNYTITLKGKIFTNKGTSYSNDRILEIRSDTPPAITGINYIQDDIKIIVPKSSLELYKNAEGWSEIASQIDSEITANEVYALVGNINTELANIIEGEGV